MSELTQDLLKELFDYMDDGNLIRKVSAGPNAQKGVIVGSAHHTGYKNVMINGKKYTLHRLIYLYHHGYLPGEIDHIDGDKVNNKIENLRAATRSQNCMNKKSDKNSSSKYKGVKWNKEQNKWIANIVFNGKQVYLGRFTDEKAAAIVYNDAAIKYHGEFARLNEILSHE